MTDTTLSLPQIAALAHAPLARGRHPGAGADRGWPGRDGLPVTVRPDGKITVEAPDGSFIDVTNYGPDPNVFTVPEFEGVQRGLRDVYEMGRIGIGIPTRAERIDD